ncbi:M14 family zinc carboxypeptidase [Alteribacillus sp. JSM 102045]|uniref:M14 family zinc carboxypeptidase n=1 Tax=Alteribacillus sp. JSM 102045 TaxID=1562101 RepID=UPI0035BF8484
MKKWKSIAGMSVLAGALIFQPFAVSADQSENSPGTPPQQEYKIDGFVDYEEMEQRLEKIEQTSQGRVEVEVIGQSNQGRDIYSARVGNGDKVVLVESEIHGNEKTGTDALLNILQYLGSSGSKHAEAIREELTLVAVPKMNPDASELDRRGNDRSWEEVVDDFPQLEGASPSWNYYTGTLQGDDYSDNPGFDVNRDFNPDLQYEPKPEDFPGSSSEPGWYIHPESQTIRDLYIDLQEEFGNVDTFIDLHHQGPHYKVGDTDRDVTMSISAQFVPDPNSEAGSKYSSYADNYNYDFSRQLNVAIYDRLQQGNSPFNNITLYPQGLDLPGTALGSFALNGSGTVLFEVRGQTHSFGQKKRGQLVKTVETGLYAVLDGMTDGSVYDEDPERYEEIPLTTR